MKQKSLRKQRQKQQNYRTRRKSRRKKRVADDTKKVVRLHLQQASCISIIDTTVQDSLLINHKMGDGTWLS